MDYDADGDLDILAGTYTGELYFYEGLGAGAFRQGQLMRNVEGVPIDCTPTGLFAMAATPEAVDIDADGDLDLVVGAGYSGVRVIENQGTRAEPVWSTEVGQLKTAAGKQIEGHVHHADWNGDGVRDLVVGGMDGSIGWHKNLGRDDLPSYGGRIALLEKRGPEKFDVGTVPSRPSYRTKVHVTDYNDDGHVDLLVGDVASLFHPAPPLTAAQQQEMADLRPAYDAAKKIREAVLAEYDAARNKGSVPPELKERLKTTWQAFRPLEEQMEALTARERDKTHGFVFLYLGGQQDVAVAAGPDWGKAAVAAYVDAARARTLAACAAKGLELPAGFLAWIDADPILRGSVYGCRKDPLPVLLGLRSLELDLGEEVVRRDYPQLALAFAIQGSYAAPRAKASGWNDGDGSPPTGALPDITPRTPLELVISGDPRVRVMTKDPGRSLDRDDHVINFLEDHAEIEVEKTTRELPPLEYDDKGVAKPRGKPVKVTRKVLRPLVGADVIASAKLQAEFNAYMKAHGHGDVALDCGDRTVHWHAKAAVRDKALRQRIAAAHKLFHDAYRAKGRMPAERDRAPTPAESMAWFVRNDRHPFTPAERASRKWPRFPLNAPWPVLLMLAADDQPLREREAIWVKFRDVGEFRTYGEYIGGIAQQFDMQSARRLSPFAFSYGSIQMMWKDGGVCGTMGNIGARTFRICGVPSSTAGQPGHCAIVRMDYDAKTGEFRCRGGQYATGGDEVTTVHAGWNYDDVGGRRRMLFHQSVAWGVSHGLASFVDALVLRRMWDKTDAATRAADGVDFVRAAMDANPFALAAIDAAIAAAPDSAVAAALLDAFLEWFDDLARPARYDLYRSTVRDMAHARVLALPAPDTKAEAARLLAALERQGCQSPKLLARSWRSVDGEEGFTRRCVAAVERYVAQPARARNKRAAGKFAAQVKVWGRSVKDAAARQAWANQLLTSFAGKEALRISGKLSLDPAVVALCQAAGRELPKVGS